jgi:pimeloyl-ACP methyl ester carboxylesterase
MSTSPTVVLVHGAFADASGYGGVIRRLQAEGLAVRAPMNPLRGLAFDADAIARYTTSIQGPVLLVGHSYGGAVISQAAPVVKDVAGLVFLAAFALDAGESCASVQEPFPASLLASTSVPSPYDAPGAAGGPLTGQAVGGLARGGRSVVMGYAAGTETTIRVTDLVWKLAHVSGFSLFAASAEEQAEAYAAVLPLIASGEIPPAHDRSFPLEQAPEALRHLVEDRPFGKVTLTVAAPLRPRADD